MASHFFEEKDEKGERKKRQKWKTFKSNAFESEIFASKRVEKDFEPNLMCKMDLMQYPIPFRFDYIR